MACSPLPSLKHIISLNGKGWKGEEVSGTLLPFQPFTTFKEIRFVGGRGSMPMACPFPLQTYSFTNNKVLGGTGCRRPVPPNTLLFIKESFVAEGWKRGACLRPPLFHPFTYK